VARPGSRPLGSLHDIAAQTCGVLDELMRCGNADRPAVFDTALAEFQRQPRIVVVEDIHSADEATLDLLRFLGRRIRRTRALLVLTYRDLDRRSPWELPPRRQYAVSLVRRGLDWLSSPAPYYSRLGNVV
jgi:hypothetical protein